MAIYSHGSALLPVLFRTSASLLFFSLPVAFAACSSDKPTIARQSQALHAECSERTDAAAPSGWVCPNALTVECRGGDGRQDVDVIHWVNTGEVSGGSCDEMTLSVSDPGPFTVGEHQIDITATAHSADAGSSLVCTADLNIVDTQAPRLMPHTLTLWPPNHKFNTVHVTDCMTAMDACNGPDVSMRFTSVTSNEPSDDLGDGHTAPDIQFDGCGNVQLRSERQGGGTGRVYTLNVRAEDPAGNVALGSCQVLVPHDQSGKPMADGGSAVEVTAPPACAGDGGN
ncbi:MAG TPA: hypothetical protein VL137_01715 [Polyangiaceae bacterium]|nr:hypothetical protein [Polyangiaceae bacterium]